MGPVEKARELADQIKRTKEFSDLKQAKMILDSNRELMSKIDNFKKVEARLMSPNSIGTNNQTKELNKMFEDLSRIPEISRFLTAEKNFNNMVLSVYKIINDSIEGGLKN